MKKQHKGLTVDNGISVTCHIDQAEKTQFPFLNHIMLTLLTFIALTGAVMTFASILHLEVKAVVMLPWLALFAVGYSVLYNVIKKHRWLVFLGTALLVGLVVLLFREQVYQGAVLLFDQGYAAISEAMYWDEVVPTFPWEEGFYTLTHLVLLLISLLLSAALTYFIVVKVNFIAVFLLTFPFFEIGAAFGAVPKLLYFAMMAATWAAVLILSKVQNAKIRIKKADGKRQKQRSGGPKGRFAAGAVAVALVVVGLFIATSTVLDALDFSRSKDLDNLRRDTKRVIADVYDYVTGKDRDGSLKEGRLYEVEDRKVKDRHYLTVETSLFQFRNDLRFKGYTASTYSNNRWGQIDNYADYEDLFAKAQRIGYKIDALRGAMLKTYEGRPFYESSKIRIRDLRRVKNYAFQTYGGYFGEEYTAYLNDMGVTPSNKREYSYTTYLGLSNLFDITRSDLYGDEAVAQVWREYGDFVQQEYTASEITPSVQALADSFDASSRNQLVDDVRLYLQANTEHSDKFTKCPNDQDFVEYFLFEEKRGYSTHYATAAAVLLQARGYPARYVEGYFIPKGEANRFYDEESGNYTTLDITDAYAHAWIEIFDETYGWIPVEVTPGYWYGSFQQELQNYLEEEEIMEEINFEEILDDEWEVEYITEITDDVETEYYTDSTRLPTTSIVAIVLGGVLVLALIGWIVCHTVCVSNRKKRLQSTDGRIAINAAYRYFMQLATFEGMDCKNIRAYLPFAKACAESSRYLEEEQTATLFNLFLKNAFSQEGATGEEAVWCVETVKTYAGRIYGGLPVHQKFLFKMIKNL